MTKTQNSFLFEFFFLHSNTKAMVEKHALFSLHLLSDPACGRESYIIFTFRTLDFGLPL